MSVPQFDVQPQYTSYRASGSGKADSNVRPDSTLAVLVLCVVLLAFPARLFAQEFEVRIESAEVDSMFSLARMAVHEARFELANDLLLEVVTLDSTLGLGWAYLAMVDLFLFRDPEVSAAAARANVGEEQALVEILIAYADEKSDRAEQLLYEFEQRFPDDPYSQHLLGQIQIDLGQPEQAVETLRELLRRRPGFSPAWNHLGHAFLAVGDLPKAGAAFGMFLELTPANPSAYDSMARYLVAKGDPEAAVEHLRRALEYEPRMAYGWMHMGDILAETGSANAAEQAYVRALEASLLYGEDFREFVSMKIEELPLE